MKHLAFGDIHGHAQATARAVALAEEHEAIAVFLGDYVDRGPSNMAVLEILMYAQSRHPDWIFLRGNHDQMLLDLIAGRDHPEGFDERTREEAYAEWQAAPEPFRSNIVQFLESTSLCHETEQHIFVHAPLKEDGLALHDKAAYDLVWNYDLEPAWQGKPFVHGHLPVNEAEFVPGRINVNTSCGYGGFLTGVSLDLGTGCVLGIYTISEEGAILDQPADRMGA